MSLFRRQPCAPCGPQPVCYREPQDVYGSGRLYLPTAMAMQLPGKAYLWGSTDMGVPISMESPCAPSIPACAPVPGSDGVSFVAPVNPDPNGTSVVGGGIFEEKPALRWDNPTLGIHHGRWALPGYIAREPDEGWWVSEGKDEYTGARAWITNMVSGLGAIQPSGPWQSGDRRPARWLLLRDAVTDTGVRLIRGQLVHGRRGGRSLMVINLRALRAGSSEPLFLGRIPSHYARLRLEGTSGLGFLETPGSKVAAFAVAAAAAFGLWYFFKKGKRQSRQAQLRASRRAYLRRRNGATSKQGFRVNDLVQYANERDRRMHPGYQGRIMELAPLSALVDWGGRRGSYWVTYRDLTKV